MLHENSLVLQGVSGRNVKICMVKSHVWILFLTLYVFLKNSNGHIHKYKFNFTTI